MEEIKRMQQNLLLIRRAVAWSAEEFGDKIGVTRQTINNLESGRNKLTKTQYIAMRSVLDAEIANNPSDTGMLKVLLEVLVDNPDIYSDEDRKKILDQANLLTPAILAGTASREAVSKEWMKSVALIGGAVGAAAAGAGIAFAGPLVAGAVGASVVSKWLARVITSSKENNIK